MAPQALSPAMVTVINQKSGKPQGMIDGGRGGILGNPFDMKGNEALRVPVCDAHDEYFERVYYGGEEPIAVAQAIAQERGLTLAKAWKRPTQKAYAAEVDRIDEIVKQGQPVQIGCYCAPSACHCDKLAAHWNRDRTLEKAVDPTDEPTKPYNPLAQLQPLNANISSHMAKDIAMAEVATQFIGKSAAPNHTPSSTRNYQQAWDVLGLANTGHYSSSDIVMVSGSGPWRGVTKDMIQKVFDSHYVPLLNQAIASKAQIVVGNAKGTDQLVTEYLKARGYELSWNTQGYCECAPQRKLIEQQHLQQSKTSALLKSTEVVAKEKGRAQPKQTIRYVYLIEEGMSLTQQQQAVAKKRVEEMLRRQIEGAVSIYAIPEFYAKSAEGKAWITDALNSLPQLRGKAVVLDDRTLEEHRNADYYQIVGISVGKDPQIKNQLKLANNLGTPAIAYNPATNQLVNLQPKLDTTKEGISR